MDIFYDWVLYGKLIEFGVFSQIWMFQLGGM